MLYGDARLEPAGIRLAQMHIGQHIRQILIEQERTTAWFARKICCSRQNVYEIFKKHNIDIDLLKRISQVLDYNFFKELSDEFESRKK